MLFDICCKPPPPSCCQPLFGAFEIQGSCQNITQVMWVKPVPRFDWDPVSEGCGSKKLVYLMSARPTPIFFPELKRCPGANVRAGGAGCRVRERLLCSLVVYLMTFRFAWLYLNILVHCSLCCLGSMGVLASFV